MSHDHSQSSRLSPTHWLKSLRERRPRVAARGTPAARQIEQEQGPHHLSIWRILINLLPVWALIIAVIIIEPTLPLRAVESLLHAAGRARLPGQATPTPTSEPVFIVEAATSVAVSSQLPPPNWPLGIAPTFTPEVQHWKENIGGWSVLYRIKPNLIATLMQIESCGNPQAVSGAGAQGLFQVVSTNFNSTENPFEPDTNARVGLSLFGQTIAGANGDLGLAFAAYNGGPSIFYTSPTEWPKETQDYQYWGSGIYEEAERGMSDSPTLQDWLASGGRSLCNAAGQTLGLR